ncbi:LytTR family DNA-binding domain-containing protein [Hymenobacter sp. DH14]|uniref:LytTR family DNA-binding domain-containing protein n=1 Tax=Hymenobacter cyanobacteriorum TaxID=2926463 RepID=A0A9X2AEF6_9BACT|nr:LytTR family DNA-binding domain-containing protein [Hymenobacter cyanobacteriorum]MCI1186757.1 LytTR family DNA-binding domain-containing protein [Hymenobacter cyanobacteriorum]
MSSPTRCLIVDDEPLAHQVLTQFIAQTPGLVLAGTCRNAMEAHEYLSSQPVDLLFLDIEMPLMNGLAFLRTLKNPPKTIITTAYREYAYDGYELDVLDYLLKPFSYERFRKATGRLQPAAAPEEEKSLLLKDQGSLFKVPYRDILYVEGCKDYVKVVTTAKTHLHHATMQAMADQLGAAFGRLHRSFIVNAAHIRRLQPEQVELTDGSLIPIGQSYKPELLAWFKK